MRTYTDEQVNALLQAALSAIQYHEAAPCIPELQAAYESLTGQSAFAYRDELEASFYGEG